MGKRPRVRTGCRRHLRSTQGRPGACQTVRALLLETDLFSYLQGPLADAYRSDVKGHILAISFMTVAELFQGAFRAGWARKQLERLEAQIGPYLVTPSSHAISRKWGEARFIRRHQPISAEDAWIAATVLEHDYPSLPTIPSTFTAYRALLRRSGAGHATLKPWCRSGRSP